MSSSLVSRTIAGWLETGLLARAPAALAHDQLVASGPSSASISGRRPLQQPDLADGDDQLGRASSSKCCAAAAGWA
jgi:hypothetical protein